MIAAPAIRNHHVPHHGGYAFLDQEGDVEQVLRVVAPDLVAHLRAEEARCGVEAAEAHDVLLEGERAERMNAGIGNQR